MLRAPLRSRPRPRRTLALVAAVLAPLAALQSPPVAAHALGARSPAAGLPPLAVTGTDGGLWVRQAGSGAFTPYGGRLTAAPASVTVTGPGTLYIGTGLDQNLWVRSDGAGWRPLSRTPVGCLDNPAAVVTVPASTPLLTVACEGRDHAVWTASATVTSAAVPVVDGWTSLGGQTVAGPALTAVGGAVGVAVTGLDGYVWTRGITSGWTQRPWTCTGHPTAAGVGTGGALLACEGLDRALWLVSNDGTGWGAPQSAAGVILQVLAVRSGGGRTLVDAEASDASVLEAAVGLGAPSPWVSLGGGVLTPAYPQPAPAASPSRRLAVAGGDGQVWVRDPGGAFVPYGGGVIAAPAAVDVPYGTGGAAPLVVATGTDRNVWVRTDASSWRPLSTQRAVCLDNPAAAVTSSPSGWRLTVACRGSDRAIWVAAGPVTPGVPPLLGAWSSLGGTVVAGPALAVLAGAVTVLVPDAAGRVAVRPVAGAWTEQPWGCIGHLAAGTAVSGTAYAACEGADGALWTATWSGASWGPMTGDGGRILQALAVQGGWDGAAVSVEGADGSAWQAAVRPDGSAVSWADIGGAVLAAPPSGVVTGVMVIVMENREYGDVIGNPAAPYINSLAAAGGLATAYYGTSHPSLPNYLEMISGQDFGVTTDCTTCSFTATTLVDELAAAGIGWRAYMESMPSPCFGGASYGEYAKKHDPFMYFTEITGNSAQCNRVVPATALSSDLAAGTAPPFMWLTPNLCDDGHDCSTSTADGWLHGTLPSILASTWYQRGGAVVVTWDEGTTSAGCCGTAAGGHVAALVLSRSTAAGARLGTAVDHAGLLRAIEETLGVGLTGDAASPVHGDLSPLF